MKKRMVLVLALATVVSCKSREKLAGRVGAFSTTKAAMEALAQARPVFERYHIRGTGTFSQGGDDVSFRFDLRMKTDSAMWIEVTDPLLGIKAARLLATKDTVIIVNLLERNFQKSAVAAPDVGRLLIIATTHPAAAGVNTKVPGLTTRPVAATPALKSLRDYNDAVPAALDRSDCASWLVLTLRWWDRPA